MVCNNLQKQLLCHRCVSGKRLADVRRFRVQITLKRSLLLSKLEEKLKNKVDSISIFRCHVGVTVSYISA